MVQYGNGTARVDLATSRLSLLPLKLAVGLVEEIPGGSLAWTLHLVSFHNAYSFLFVVKIPSLRVHFHLFLTRCTLSYVQSM